MENVQLQRSLGELIRSNRVAAGLTQAALGRRAGIVGKYVSEIERGTRDIPLSTLLAVVEDGLKLQLYIAFRRRGEDTISRSTSLVAEEIASRIADVPESRRSKLMSIVRAMIELVQ